MSPAVPALAVKISPWRSKLRNVVLIASAVVVLSRSIDAWSTVPHLVAFGFLFAALFVISWCLGLWAFADAYHPSSGWLRADSRASFYFPWLRTLFLALLGVILALPILVTVFTIIAVVKAA